MNQETNNFNQNNSNAQGNNTISNDLNNQNNQNNQSLQSNLNLNMEQNLNINNQQTTNSTMYNSSNQNFNNKTFNKKKLGLIIGVVLGIIVIIIATITLKSINIINNNSAKISNKSLINKNSKFSFIYNFYKISDDYWSEKNKEYSYLNYDNRKAFNTLTNKDIGYVWGNLSNKTSGFSEIIEVGNGYSKPDYYTLSLKNNKFVFIKQIKVIEDKPSNIVSILYLNVLGNDLKTYHIELSIEKNPTDIELKENEWTMNEYNQGGDYSITSYYKMTNQYCLKLDFPDSYSNETLNKINAERKNYPYDADDIKELANKVTSLITLSKNENQVEPEHYYFTVPSNDYSIDNNFTINLSTMKFISWHSGAPDLVKLVVDIDGQPYILAYNSNYDWISIQEWVDKTKYDNYLSYFKMDLKEYTYHNKKIYIEYYNENAGDLKGLYHGIAFKNDDAWYTLSSTTSKKVNPNSDNIDNWISDICSGIISFNEK